jgi:hypothetical protein
MTARTLLGANTDHDLGTELLLKRDGHYVCKARCYSCPLPIVTTGSTELEARQKVWRLIRQHQGNVFAAGPGWQAVAA